MWQKTADRYRYFLRQRYQYNNAYRRNHIAFTNKGHDLRLFGIAYNDTATWINMLRPFDLHFVPILQEK